MVQIEYALAAVASGAASVGIKATNGVVLATEKKHKSILYEEHSTYKVEQITDTIGMVYSGMGPDYRVLVRRARKMAQEYMLEKGEDIPTAQLVSRVAMVMQEFTQSGGVRPFGVSLLIAGWDQNENKPVLFQCDPSGAYFAWKATAMGKNYVNAKTFLEKRFDDKLEVRKCTTILCYCTFNFKPFEFLCTLLLTYLKKSNTLFSARRCSSYCNINVKRGIRRTDD